MDRAAAHLRLVGDEADDAALQPGEPDHELLRPVGLDLEERAAVDEPVDHRDDVVADVRVLGDQPVPAGGLGLDGLDVGRRPGEVVGQVGQEQAGGGERLPVLLEHGVAAAGDLGVHPRAAHLLGGGVLAGDLLGHPRRREVHRPAALDHPDPVGERRHVGAARGRRAVQAADLRDPPGQRDLQVEDPRGAAAPGEEAHLLGEPPARRVDEVEDREQVAVGPLEDADLLLAGALAPRPGLDAEVVRDHRHGPALDRPDAGDDAVARHPGLGGRGQEAVLDEAARVEQHVQALPHGELLGPAPGVPAEARPVGGREHVIPRGRCRRPGGMGRRHLPRGTRAVGRRLGHGTSRFARISSWISSVPPPMRRMRTSRWWRAIGVSSR